ncbi:hypothetical protein V6N13_009437 [Hibiscus sabdariffa]
MGYNNVFVYMYPKSKISSVELPPTEGRDSLSQVATLDLPSIEELGSTRFIMLCNQLFQAIDTVSVYTTRVVSSTTFFNNLSLHFLSLARLTLWLVLETVRGQKSGLWIGTIVPQQYNPYNGTGSSSVAPPLEMTCSFIGGSSSVAIVEPSLGDNSSVIAVYLGLSDP